MPSPWAAAVVAAQAAAAYRRAVLVVLALPWRRLLPAALRGSPRSAAVAAVEGRAAPLQRSYLSTRTDGAGGAGGILLGLGLWTSWFQTRSVTTAEESFYDILGVGKDASDQDIKKAYKRAAVKNHPDKAPESERAVYEERFKRISRAYEILSDPQKRRVYDAQGAAAFDGHDADGGAGGGFPGGAGGMDPFDMFRGMFGGQGFGRRKTPDVGYAMTVTLEELYKGCTREVKYDQDCVCRICRGRGATRLETCRTCRGSGVQVTTRQIAPGYVQQMQHTCRDCGGQGATVPPGSQCSECRGSGMVQNRIRLPVEVPAGCPNRHRFVFRGKADEMPDMETGDIIVEVQEKPHTTFQRLGTDLLVERRVPLLDALCGVHFCLKHVDGSDMEIRCKEGEIVRPGEVWVVPGRGMPSPSQSGRYGDLLVRFEVDFPSTLPSSQGGPALREQLRPLIDPKAPAEPQAASGGGWFSKLSGGGSKTPAVTANRAEQRRARDVAERLAEKQRQEAAERGGAGRGGQNGVECAQM